MKHTFLKTAAGLKIYNADKHVKTVSQVYEEVLADDLIQEITKEKKIRVSESDRNILDRALKDTFIPKYLERLKKEEKYVYELVENATVTGVREVKTKGENRYELVFDNEVKLKIPAEIYHVHDMKLPTVHLNY